MNNKDEFGDLQPAPRVFGEPGTPGQSASVQQGYDDTCVIQSQRLILRDFGIDLTEDALRDQAMANGWYVPGQGSHPDHVGNLLELHNVPVNRYEDANIFNLTSELAQGHKVIIGVDSGELWNKGIWEGMEDRLGLERADHALLVSGIDTSDAENIKVILTDPGSGDVAKEYPMEQFVDAWKDSGCFMVATELPAPATLDEMANFDYEAGHIPSIGEMPYEDFQEANEIASGLSLSFSGWSQVAEYYHDCVLARIPAVQFAERLVEAVKEAHMEADADEAASATPADTVNGATQFEAEADEDADDDQVDEEPEDDDQDDDVELDDSEIAYGDSWEEQDDLWDDEQHDDQDDPQDDPTADDGPDMEYGF